MGHELTRSELLEAVDHLTGPTPNLVLAEHLTALALIKIRAAMSARMQEELQAKRAHYYATGDESKGYTRLASTALPRATVKHKEPTERKTRRNAVYAQLGID